MDIIIYTNYAGAPLFVYQITITIHTVSLDCVDRTPLAGFAVASTSTPNTIPYL